jgi:hypothetical protein
MRVSKSKVALLSAAVAASLISTAANAQLNVNTGATPVTYAQELTIPAGGLLIGGAVSSQVTGQLGFGASATDNRYIRLDFTNATFNVAAPDAGMTVTGATATRVFGGQAGTSFVVYQLTSTAGIADSAVFTWQPIASQFKLTAAQTVQVRYTLHETATSSQLGQTGAAILVNGTPRDYIRFAPVLAFSMAAPQTELIAATTTPTPFTAFCNNGAGPGLPGTAGCAASATDLLGIVGTVATYGLVNTTTLDANNNAITLLATVLASATIDVTSDATTFPTGSTYGFTANTANCSALGAGGVLGGTPAGTVVTYTLPVTGTGFAATPATALCGQVTGTTAVSTQSFSGLFKPVAAAGYTVANANAGTIGTWRRDGTELQTPWFAFSQANYNTRFFFMNTGTQAAPCTTRLISETGNTLTAGTGASFTIPAGGQIQVTTADLVASATGAGRAAAVFNCLAPTQFIQGRFVVTSNVNGSFDTGHLMRPGTN